MVVLRELGVYFRPVPERRQISPRASVLAGIGQLNLATNSGELDILCRLSGGHGYDDLLPHTVELQDFDLMLRVLDLPMLLQVKTETSRPKDRLMLPILIAALEERGETWKGQAQAARSGVERAVETFAKHYTPVVVLAALISSTVIR